jgi:hypothetical protein
MNKKCSCGSKQKGKTTKVVVRTPVVRAPSYSAPKKSVMRSGEANILGRIMYQF